MTAILGNIPDDQYRIDGYVTFSKLKVARRSLKLYKRMFVTKEAEPDWGTPSMVRGTAAHAMILEGQGVFESLFSVVPDAIRRNTKAWEAYEAGGKTAIKASDYKTIENVANAIDENPAAVAILEESTREVVARHPGPIKPWSFGLQGRLDLLAPTGVADLKLTDEFDKRHQHIAARDYVGQLAFYDWIRTDDRMPPGLADAQIICAESCEPFRVQVIRIPARSLVTAHIENLKALARLDHAIRNDQWNDDTPDVTDWEAPGWWLDRQEIQGIEA